MGGPIFGHSEPFLGFPESFLGLPEESGFGGPPVFEVSGHQGGFVVSNPAFLRGRETWLWVPCFWGAFKVGGPIFGSPRAIFGVPRCVPFQGPPGFEVFGGTRGFCGVKSSIFGGPRDVALGFLFLG